ncbi:MAG: PASTA domain-containing protein, partial [Lachnospiraceae bacterium]|nr:PASTA domain-containing protein [Lachnospiraceae bacterium]
TPDPLETATVETVESEHFDPKVDTVVPNVLGLPFADAVEALRAADLEYITSSTFRYSDIYPSGTIMNQNIPEGTIVRKYSSIVLSISLGTDKFEIRDFTGVSLDAFREEFNKFSSIIQVTYQGVYSDSVLPNTIVSTNPDSGILSEGDSIHVMYSKGPVYVSMPNLIGMTSYQAEAQLKRTGLEIGEIFYDYSNTVASGLVCKQQYNADETVHNGSYIDITISNGPEPISVPNVVGLDEQRAVNTLRNLGFQVRVIYSQSESASASQNGKVARMTPSDSVQLYGSTIELTVLVAVVRLQDMAGKTEAEARDLLERQNLTVTVTYEETDNPDLDKTVRGMNPAAGTTVNFGSAVQLTVYRCTGYVKVPDVVGKTEAEARDALEKLGLTVVIVSASTADESLEGTVQGTNPASGATAKVGSEVEVAVYKQDLITVPDVVGMPEAVARGVLGSAGFQVHVLTVPTDTPEQSGSVASTDPAGGTGVKPGSMIEVRVYSFGKILVPDVVGKDVEEAKKIIDDLGLTFSFAYRDVEDASLEGIVYSTDPKPNVYVEPGSNVELTLYRFVPPATEAPPETEVPPVTEAPPATEAPPVTEAPPAPEGPGEAEVPPATEAPATEAPATEAPAEAEVPPVTDTPAEAEVPPVTDTPAEADHKGPFTNI